jgi:predicted  nucleic acid-binding Zn-ribbon protein
MDDLGNGFAIAAFLVIVASVVLIIMMVRQQPAYLDSVTAPYQETMVRELGQPVALTDEQLDRIVTAVRGQVDTARFTEAEINQIAAAVSERTVSAGLTDGELYWIATEVSNLVTSGLPIEQLLQRVSRAQKEGQQEMLGSLTESQRQRDNQVLGIIDRQVGSLRGDLQRVGEEIGHLRETLEGSPVREAPEEVSEPPEASETILRDVEVEVEPVPEENTVLEGEIVETTREEVREEMREAPSPEEPPAPDETPPDSPAEAGTIVVRTTETAVERVETEAPPPAVPDAEPPADPAPPPRDQHPRDWSRD